MAGKHFFDSGLGLNYENKQNKLNKQKQQQQKTNEKKTKTKQKQNQKNITKNKKQKKTANVECVRAIKDKVIIFSFYTKPVYNQHS
jgi:hypothetical protein